ncbi:Ankyrin repeat-containing domain protein [Russula decolorans]
MKRLFDADQPHFAIWLWLYNEETVVQSMHMVCPQKPNAVPLYYAAKFGFRDLAEDLIAEHPDQINAWGGFHRSPMHAAAREGHINILSLLLDHGVDVEVRRTFHNETPLIYASWAGQREAALYLIDRGADINAEDFRKCTPLFIAFRGDVEGARMLLERGAAIDIRNIDGETPLHQSVRYGKIELVRFFLEHGLDPNLPNELDETPSYMALRYSDHEILDLLSEYGGKPVKVVNKDSRLYKFVRKSEAAAALLLASNKI